MNIKDKFINAIKNGHTDIVHQYIKSNGIEEYYDFSIEIAARRGYIEIVNILLQQKSTNPNINNSEPLILATQYGHFETVKLLLNDPRVDPVGICNIPIKSASFNNDEKIIQLLWSDERIKNTLENDDLQLYNELIQRNFIKKIQSF